MEPIFRIDTIYDSLTNCMIYMVYDCRRHIYVDNGYYSLDEAQQALARIALNMVSVKNAKGP